MNSVIYYIVIPCLFLFVQNVAIAQPDTKSKDKEMKYQKIQDMSEGTIIDDFLENAVQKARQNIKEKGRIETEDAIPLILKLQYNHIAHLRKEMVIKTEFNAFKQYVEYRFNGLESEIDLLRWIMLFGFAFLAILITILGVLQGYSIFNKRKS